MTDKPVEMRDNQNKIAEYIIKTCLTPGVGNDMQNKILFSRRRMRMKRTKKEELTR